MGELGAGSWVEVAASNPSLAEPRCHPSACAERDLVEESSGMSRNLAERMRTGVLVRG